MAEIINVELEQESILETLSELAVNVGISDEIKQALLQCFEHVAWVDDEGQTYYDALYDALYPPVDLSSISCVYTQSGTVYDTDTLDSLKSDLVVTAHYSDQSTQTITTYTLSGTLAEGTSTITVSYLGKTTTFNVTVTPAIQWDIDWDYTKGDPTNYGFASSVSGTGASAQFLANGVELNGGYGSVSFYKDPNYAVAHGVAEVVFTVTQMNLAYQGMVFIASTGTQGFRVRIYNNGLYWGTSTNTEATDVKIADISADTQYTLNLEWSSSGVIVQLNGETVKTAQFTSTSTRFVLTNTGKQSTGIYAKTVIHAVRLREVA